MSGCSQGRRNARENRNLHGKREASTHAGISHSPSRNFQLRGRASCLVLVGLFGCRPASLQRHISKVPSSDILTVGSKQLD